MNGAQIVIKALLECGVNTVFGYPGGSIIKIYDELYSNTDKINHFLVAHEQGAAHAADGYARSTGKVGVCMATSGPGATNLVTGIATAYMDSVPLVAITCNVPTNLIGSDAFQEVDIVGITNPITKHNGIVRDVNDLEKMIKDAFRIAKEGRPGPVLIDIPSDILVNECEYKDYVSKEKATRATKEENVEKAIEVINKSAKPVILVGGGAGMAKCSKEVEELSNKLNAPVVSSLMGLGVYNKENFFGMVGMHGKKAANIALVKSDLIIAVGTRLNDRIAPNKNSFGAKKKLVHIDLDRAEIDKNINSFCHITGDAKSVLKKLNAKVNAKDDKAFIEMLNTKRALRDKIFPQEIMESINAQNPKGFMVTDVGQHQMWVAQYFNFENYGQLLTSGGLGTMGYGLGAAIGAKVGNKKTPVTLVTGDGCFGMNCNELHTVSRYKVPVIICLMNNGVLGMVRQWQTLFFDKHYSGTILGQTCDYESLAKAYGLDYSLAKDKKDFDLAYEKALKSGMPTIINCIIDKDELVAPMFNKAKSADNFVVE